MHTLFISDLHLEDGRPETTHILTRFLRGPATEADALYILGDLFEFWIGDDVLSDTARWVAAEVAALRKHSVSCYFMHGNRDFLLGTAYARKAGLDLLPESVIIDLYGVPTLLLHGDTLCVDDVEYQAFRRKVRSKKFQKGFLQETPERRLQMAQTARDASKRHIGSLPDPGIADVNESAVRDAFATHGVARMIHGHTHRPGCHEHNLAENGIGQRFVLADWHRLGGYLRVNAQGCSLKLYPDV